jgi:ribonuclease HII
MFDANYFLKQTKKNIFFVAGCDEVGRGPLAGPVVAACVCIDVQNYNSIEISHLLEELKSLGVTDSKKTKENKRKEIISAFNGLENYISEVFKKNTTQKFIFNYSKNISIKFSIQYLSPLEIDKINILNASLEAMRRAAREVCDLDGIVLIDGNKKFKPFNDRIEFESIVKGDSRSLLIGLASIIAKQCRDNYMVKLSKKYPSYDWDRNAGYPTKNHLLAIKTYGITKYHRRTFKGVKEFCN